MLRVAVVLLGLSGVAHAGFGFTWSHTSSHSSWNVSVGVGGYGAAVIPVPARSFGVIHGRRPTPGNRFLATTENVWFYNPYDPPSYRTFGLVYLDADGRVTGVSEYPKSGRGFDFDLTVIQREAAIRERGLGTADAAARKARSAAIRAGLDFLRSRHYVDAQTALKGAVWIDPEDGPAQMLYGIALLASGEVPPAAKAVRRGLEAMPEFRAGWARLADLVPDRGERERIVRDIESRLAADAGNAGLRFLAGWLLFSQGEPARAAEHWKLLPEDPFRARLLALASG